MKALVTGGAGFIGSHIVDRLIEMGNDVAVVDNLATGRMELLNPEAKFYLMDLQRPELSKMFEHEKFDIVFHQAAQMDVRRSVADPLYDADANIRGGLNLLQTAVNHDVKKVIFASSGGVAYGEQEVFPCDETHPLNPISPYGVAKVTMEKYCYYFAKEFGLKYTALRYANVYGPRQNPHGEAGVVSIFIKKMLAGEQPVINGDGKQSRDYVYVEDVVEANMLAMDCKTNEAFNVGTAIETDVNAIFHYLNKLTGNKSEEKHGPAKPGEQLRSVLNWGKINNQLGWSPKVELEEGFKKTVQYFLDHQ